MSFSGFRLSLQMITGPLVAVLAVVAVIDSVTQPAPQTPVAAQYAA